MNVFIANFGRANSYWSECQRRSSVAAFNDEDVHPFWVARDREGWIAHCLARKRTAAGITPTKPIASRWFNLMDIVSESAGDLWIHREKSDIWWTTTSTEAAEIQLIDAFEPDNDGTRHYVANKPAAPWSNKSRVGAPLRWDALHPRAKEFLFTEGTLQQLSPENSEYARALIDGADLSSWHASTDWLTKADASKRAPATAFNARQRAVQRMVMTVGGTVANARGQEITRTAKVKELRMTPLELEHYVSALIEAQEGLCAITGIRLQYDGEHEDGELLCSLDRIDSSGHYERGNLQIVSKFVNRWKNDEADAGFRRLIALVRAST